MKRNSVIGLVGVGVIALCIGAWYFTMGSGAAPSDTPSPVEAVGEADVVITRTKDGYEPKEVTINTGDIVEWVNQSGEFHWPASDLHPTHGVYPEFDPLRPIADGESWKFQFDKPGVWKYHDHIRANKVGTITVQ